MLKFKYTAKIHVLPAYGEKKPVENLTGTLEASDQSSAYELVKIFAWDRCQELKMQRGDLFGYENVQVALLSKEQNWTVPTIINLIKSMIAQAEANEQKFRELTYQAQEQAHRESARIEMNHCAGQKIALQVLLCEIVGNDLPLVTTLGN